MGPLQDIKVLDLTSMVSGPVAAMMPGDQGADVIKVEPIHGQQLRYLGERHNDVAANLLLLQSQQEISLEGFEKRCWQGSTVEAHR